MNTPMLCLLQCEQVCEASHPLTHTELAKLKSNAQPREWQHYELLCYPITFLLAFICAANNLASFTTGKGRLEIPASCNPIYDD